MTDIHTRINPPPPHTYIIQKQILVKEENNVSELHAYSTVEERMQHSLTTFVSLTHTHEYMHYSPG